MKALTLTEIKSPLVLQERDDPQPGDQEVVVRINAAALNRRDYWITQGMYPGIECPVVLGSDGAGVVEQTGAALGNYWDQREVILNPGFDWGDNPRVQSDAFKILGMPQDGTFATHVVVPAEALHLKPSHLSWEEAAALPLAGVTAYRAVFTQGGLQPGETIVINGIGGGVATFALQFAVAAGADVWVTSSSEEKITRAVAMGAKGGFDYTSDDWGRALTSQAGAPDLIIDSAGGSGYDTLLKIAAPGARIVNYGSTAGPPEKLDLFKVFWKQLTVQGSTMGSPADFAAMLELVDEHKIRPVVDEVAPLAQGNAVVSQMKSSPQFGKYVLVVNET
ncbi:MAG: zinc-binding dehydrogenase [Pirellulaceae bacterium]|nr:zinc-binding dehydrogenase [Pirellulaceae bacterium]